jgi:hypothetical protein
MHIFDEDWVFSAYDVAEKQEALDYAQSCGIPLRGASEQIRQRLYSDRDLDIGAFMGGLVPCTFDAGIKAAFHVVSYLKFKKLCDEYKANPVKWESAYAGMVTED